jgi:hypothetical protein
MVSVATAGPYSALPAPEKAKRPVMVWLPLSQGLGIFGLLLFGKDGRRKKPAYLIMVFLIVSLLLVGCGGGTRLQSSESHVTPAGTYRLLVVGKSGAAQHSVTLTLNVQ